MPNRFVLVWGVALLVSSGEAAAQTHGAAPRSPFDHTPNWVTSISPEGTGYAFDAAAADVIDYAAPNGAQFYVIGGGKLVLLMDPKIADIGDFARKMVEGQANEWVTFAQPGRTRAVRKAAIARIDYAAKNAHLFAGDQTDLGTVSEQSVLKTLRAVASKKAH
jgi:hypothetical protein